MFKIKDTVYADAGNLIKGNRVIAFQVVGELNDFTEEAVYIDDMHLEGETIVCNRGNVTWTFPHTDYGAVKKQIIGLRYNNDDQIALILNREESEEGAFAYGKMQEWRDWASIVAKKVVALFNQNEEE
ncbi:MAG: hypothetical protein J6T94_05545 [Bacteroidaceae bacterium]|nr:hypothetical protein [Bacteroidaceae bacterium]